MGKLIRQLMRKIPFEVKQSAIDLVATFNYAREPFHHDQRLNEIFQQTINKIRSGFYLDVGALDGRMFSNTWHLENGLDWRGILIEPNPESFHQLSRIRDPQKNVLIQKAIVGQDSKKDAKDYTRTLLAAHSMTIDLSSAWDVSKQMNEASKFMGSNQNFYTFTVPASTLEEVLIESQAPEEIDFMSLDIEGAELEICLDFPLVNYRIKYLLIETDINGLAIRHLEKNGYKVIFYESVAGNAFLEKIY